MAWTDEARAAAIATRKANAKHPAKGAKLAKALKSVSAAKGLTGPMVNPVNPARQKMNFRWKLK